MQIVNSIVKLDRAKFYARHGVLPQEQDVGAYFFVTLEVTTDISAAIYTDDLSGTVSYADLYDCVKKEMAIPSKLIEHVAGRILNRLYSQFPSISHIKLILTKENPPMGADCKGAGIIIESVR